MFKKPTPRIPVQDQHGHRMDDPGSSCLLTFVLTIVLIVVLILSCMFIMWISTGSVR